MATSTPAPNLTTREITKPTLLHLQHSSSQIILWLLEELQIDYDLRLFDRPEGPAPHELRETHPQGKSPQLLLPGGRVITQVSAITLYLLRTYDTSHRFHNPEVDDPVREEQLVCIGVSDIAGKMGMILLWHGITLKSPFFIRPLFNKTRKFLHELFLDYDLKATLDVFEMELGEDKWFLGREEPGRVDFILHYFVDMVIQAGYIKWKDGKTGKEQYPRLQAWMARCEEREGWKRSLEKGNGYDLDFPGRWSK
ncbi:hypothetical protein V8F20_008918 [Naviculisporaceae sp. PSN 640]